MKKFFIYIWLEFKRFFKILPFYALCGMILAGIALLTFFTAKNVFSAKTLSNYKLKIAVVIEDESDIMNMLFQMLESADCTSDTCEFIETDIENGNKMIDNKEVTALLVIPSGFVYSIKDGSNIPIEITFSKSSNMISLILKQLSIAGAKTMSSAQCGIYTQYDIYSEHNKMFYNPEANAYLNETYLKYVLERETIFQNSTAYPTGKLSIAESYACSGIAFIILLICISCATFFDNENNVFKLYMNSRGIPSYVTHAVKIMVFSIFTFLMLYMIKFISGMSFFALSLLPAILCSGCISVFLLSLCLEVSTGVLTLFIANFAACFISGYFLPSAFFPEFLQKAGNILPSGIIFKQVQYSFDYGNSYTYVLIFYSLIFYIMTLISEKFIRRLRN